MGSFFFRGIVVCQFFILLPAILIEKVVHARQTGGVVHRCNTPESEPVVEIFQSGSFNGIGTGPYAKENNDDLIGTISSSNFFRFWDGTCGSYKIPIRIVAPKDFACNTGRLAHLGLIELIHPNFIGGLPPGEFEGKIHAWNDPVYHPLLDHGFHEAWANFREPFLFDDPSHGGGGVIYMGFQANNFYGELDYIAALPENAGIGLHLERPQDYAILYRDVSKWLRQVKTPANFINAGRQDLCSVSDVIGFGYSYTSSRLKAVISDPHKLNSRWGKDSIFPRGRVMDGMFLGGFLGMPERKCPKVPKNELNSEPCNEPSEVSEGPVVLVQSETDIQYFPALNARPGFLGFHWEFDHYKVHEINSASHIDFSYFPMGPILELFGIDPSFTRQNPLDRSPVFRADLINLLDKIRRNKPLPRSVYSVARKTLSSDDLGIVFLDPATGNGFGGITLPQASAPLGLYRGTDCHNAFSVDFDMTDAYHYARYPLGSGDLRWGQANFVLESSPGLPPGELCASSGGIEGLLTPYQVVDDAMGTQFCDTLYPTRQAYSDRVVAAADDLVAERFLLPEDRDAIVEEAEANADLFPECVPAN